MSQLREKQLLSDGMAVFVPYAVPGDVVDPTDTKKNSYAEGRSYLRNIPITDYSLVVTLV